MLFRSELRYAALGISPSGPSGGLTNAKTIRLVGDIERPSDGSLIVVSRQVTIDLNGHKLDRKQPHVAQNDGEGHVIEVHNSVRLTIKDGSSRKTGTITGGWAERGGGIYVCAKGPSTSMGVFSPTTRHIPMEAASTSKRAARST